MTEASTRPLLRRSGTRRQTPDEQRPTPPATQLIEIVAPDRYCTALLLEYAAPLFPAEIVAGSGWAVRLQPPAGEGGAWVLELLALVEQWLESARLPCAKALYGGRSYLFHGSTEIAQFRTATESLSTLPAEVH
jgi:hypothetical protein